MHGAYQKSRHIIKFFCHDFLFLSFSGFFTCFFIVRRLWWFIFNENIIFFFHLWLDLNDFSFYLSRSIFSIPDLINIIQIQNWENINLFWKWWSIVSIILKFQGRIMTQSMLVSLLYEILSVIIKKISLDVRLWEVRKQILRHIYYFCVNCKIIINSLLWKKTLSDW